MRASVSLAFQGIEWSHKTRNNRTICSIKYTPTSSHLLSYQERLSFPDKMAPVYLPEV